MKITDFLTTDRVVFSLKSKNKQEIIKEMAELFLKDGNIVKEGSFNIFVEDLLEREALTSTGMQDGISIPHAKSPAIEKMALALAIIPEGVDFDSFDGEDSKLIFMIAAPENVKKEHLELLQKISKLTYEEEILEEIINEKDAFKVIKLLSLV